MCVCVCFILFYLKNKLIAKHTHIFLITLLPNEERKWCDLAVFFLGLLKLYLPKLMRKQERKWRNGFWTKLAQQLATFSCLFFFFLLFSLFRCPFIIYLFIFVFFVYIFFTHHLLFFSFLYYHFSFFISFFLYFLCFGAHPLFSQKILFYLFFEKEILGF